MIILFLSDIVILFLVLLLALQIRSLLPLVTPAFTEFSGSVRSFIWFLPIWIFILAYEGAYTRKYTLWDEVKLLWKTTVFSTITLFSVLFLSKMSAGVSRTVVVLMAVLSAAIFPVLRITVKRLLVSSGLLKTRVLIVGAGSKGRKVLDALRREPNLGYEVAGFIADTAEKKRSLQGIKIYNRLEQVERFIKPGDIQDVVIALSGTDKERLSRFVNKLQHKVRNVLYIPDISGLAVVGTELRHFFQDQLFAIEIKNSLAQPVNYFVKRLSDYLIGIALFFVLAIPLLIIAIAIRMTSAGPGIFKQERIGRRGKPFLCYKFRTMHKDAEERLQTILESNPSAKTEWDTHWKLRNDPRVTSIGSFLRKTSLDELPQIFNVLKGDMSLVGPRPYLPSEWDAIKEYSELIHSVPPGITGLWQVSGRSNSSYEQRLNYDSWYVRNWNMWLDMVIMMKTVKVVLKKEGAR